MWENPFGGLGVAVSMNQIMGSWRDFGKLAKNDEGLEDCALICASFRPKGLWFCDVVGNRDYFPFECLPLPSFSCAEMRGQMTTPSPHRSSFELYNNTPQPYHVLYSPYTGDNRVIKILLFIEARNCLYLNRMRTKGFQ